MRYFQTAMGKLVTGEGSKRGNSACHVEFKTGMKTQYFPGTMAFMSGKMPSQRPPELECVLGGGGHRSVFRKLELDGNPADSCPSLLREVLCGRCLSSLSPFCGYPTESLHQKELGVS